MNGAGTVGDEQSSTRNLRVLHFPLPTAGHPSSLVAAERRLGVQSELVSLRSTPYGYAADRNLGLEGAPPVWRLMRRLGFGLAALGRYDVFHFNTGQSFVPLRVPMISDLPLLKTLGKKVFVTVQGCDARQTSTCPARSRWPVCSAGSGACPCDPSLDRRKSRRLRSQMRWADGVFCLNPDLLELAPGAELVPYASVDPKQIDPAFSAVESRQPMLVLHAPTDRRKKGTEAVLEARDRLRDHPEIRFELVEGRTHRETLEACRKADLVIDQLRIGWYGGFAVEAMSFGKPVIAYVREQDLGRIPKRMAAALPLVRTTAEELSDVLRGLAARRSELAAIGRAGRSFVEAWHDPDRIAARLVKLYTGQEQLFWPEQDPTGV